MSIPLFHPTNKFSIYKTNDEQKIVHFKGHKIGLYYKLYSILRKKQNYNLRTATVCDITGRVLMCGGLNDIIEFLIDELKQEHKYTFSIENSDGGDVYHWCDDEETLVDKLSSIHQKFVDKIDGRQYINIKVINFNTKETYADTIPSLIAYFSRVVSQQKEQKEQNHMDVQNNLCVTLDFSEVLEEMKGKILFGDDKEKAEAKAILAYVATKLAEQ